MIIRTALPLEYRRFYRPDGTVSREDRFNQRYLALDYTYHPSTSTNFADFLSPLPYKKGRVQRSVSTFVNYVTKSKSTGDIVTEGSLLLGDAIAPTDAINLAVRKYNYHYPDTNNRAINNLNNSNLNLGMTYMGANQTFGMVAKAAGDIRKMFRYLKSGNLKAAAKVVGLDSRSFKNTSYDASSRYLEFIFGWKQLLSDAYASVNEFEVARSTPPPLITSRISSTYKMDYSKDRKYSSIFGPLGVLHTKCDLKLYSLTRFDYEVSSWNTVMLGRAGILNPALIAWDVVPFSFVLDWFFPVGSFLSAFTAQAGLTYLGGSTTLYVEGSMNSSFTVANDRSYECKAGVVNAYKDDFFYVNRNVVSYPIPMLPNVRYPKSLSQAITAVALITQRVFR